MPELRSSRWASPSGRVTSSIKVKHEIPGFLSQYTQNQSSKLKPTTVSHPSTTPASTNARSTSPAKPPKASEALLQKPSLTREQKVLITRHQDHAKYLKLTRRLGWKSKMLLLSYQCTLEHIHQQSLNVTGWQSSFNSSIPAMEAEMMFKVDFFEFYVLLERVLVHLLGVFGIQVSAVHGMDIDSIDGDGTRTAATSGRSGVQASIVGDSRSFHNSAHRFHANVLTALDQHDNPLHNYLGQGQVRDYLGIAKEFRNRWKDAEEKDKNERDDELIGSRYEKLIRDLRLAEMLESINAAVRACASVANDSLKEYGDRFSGGRDMGELMELDAMEDLVVLRGGGEIPIEALDDMMDCDD